MADRFLKKLVDVAPNGLNYTHLLVLLSLIQTGQRIQRQNNILCEEVSLFPLFFLLSFLSSLFSFPKNSEQKVFEGRDCCSVREETNTRQCNVTRAVMVVVVMIVVVMIVVVVVVVK